jgi:ribonuclease J
VFMTVVINEKFELADDIVLLADGIPEDLEEDLLEAAEKAFDSMPRSRRKDDATVEETMRTSVRREADAIWGKKPVCKVVVVRV